jgi:predicted lipoprotein with Yx(FWY)xxD motif
MTAIDARLEDPMRPSIEVRRRPRRWRLLMSLALAVALAACSAPGAVPSSAVAPSPAPTASAIVATPSPATSGGGRGDYDYIEPMATKSAAASEAPAVGTGVQVNVATGPLGAYLTGPDGLTLYTFKPDSANTSTCDGGCAEAWPPFTVAVDATLEPGDGVEGELTTFTRADGSLQVAYDGAPLYYFANDTKAGDTNGQGLGDNWFVAEP